MRPAFELFEIVYEKTGMTKQDLQGRWRIKKYVHARRLFALLAREDGYSFNRIGRMLRRDHATITAYRDHDYYVDYSLFQFTRMTVPKNIIHRGGYLNLEVLNDKAV